MIKGRAGSGKTLLSLAFLMNRLEQGKIDKIIVFCNTVATVNSAKLGFYPGSRDEKLMDSQIGNLLASKFGGRIEVERMIENEQLVLLQAFPSLSTNGRIIFIFSISSRVSFTVWPSS